MSRVLYAMVLLVLALAPAAAWATPGGDILGDGAISLVEDARQLPVSSSLRLILILTALTFVPAVVLVMTPFTRFIIVFSLLRQALGLQSAPPNQVLIGLSLFLSAMVMQPVLEEVHREALMPFMEGHLEPADALALALEPMREFMLSNTRRTDLAAMLSIGAMDTPDSVDAIPTSVVVSAFVLSELKTALVIAIKVYLPFLVIDMVVASLLLGMGMMMLPPVIISLPFKLLLFVLMDGWNLLVRSMAAGFA